MGTNVIYSPTTPAFLGRARYIYSRSNNVETFIHSFEFSFNYFLKVNFNLVLVLEKNLIECLVRLKNSQICVYGCVKRFIQPTRKSTNMSIIFILIILLISCLPIRSQKQHSRKHWLGLTFVIIIFDTLNSFPFLSFGLLFLFLLLNKIRILI